MTRHLPPAIVACTMDTWRAEEDMPAARTFEIAEETPISLTFNGMAHGVMMRRRWIWKISPPALP
ncbi:hypothetical protein [Komagataeibacter kakiaceti]|uniref:hypothetical protein n=1 Tax=Komagataeibacter kakiaceti TaxID=943261 RepID=UPI000471F76D|nr:hypothetical protein [Komagataeibacter kakiaceti]